MDRLCRLKYKWLGWSLAGLMFFFAGFSPAGAWAQRKIPPRQAAATVKYGKVVKVLPAGHNVVRVGKINYHYGNGIFYQTRGRQWVVVRPPIGAVVSTLTASAILVRVSGTPYYVCEGIYYKKVPAGYEVVEVKAAPDNAPAAGERVQVIVPLLNMRSGPGTHHSVSRQIPEGTLLTIKGSGSSWLYIELEDGTAGWVMKKFTGAVTPSPQG